MEHFFLLCYLFRGTPSNEIYIYLENVLLEHLFSGILLFGILTLTEASFAEVFITGILLFMKHFIWNTFSL